MSFILALGEEIFERIIRDLGSGGTGAEPSEAVLRVLPQRAERSGQERDDEEQRPESAGHATRDDGQEREHGEEADAVGRHGMPVDELAHELSVPWFR